MVREEKFPENNTSKDVPKNSETGFLEIYSKIDSNLFKAILP